MDSRSIQERSGISMNRCYVCMPYLKEDEEFMSDLDSLYDEVVVHQGNDRPTKDELKEIVEEYETIVVGTSEELDSEVAEAAENLEVIGSLSSGLDHIDIEAFKEQGVEIHSIDEANAVSVAEHTFGLMLALEKRLIESQKSVLEGQGRDGLDERPEDLKGKTLGIIGAGSIAYEVAKKAPAFDLETKVWTFNPEKHGELKDLGAEFATELPQLVSQSDIVTIHVPLTGKTRNLIDTELLEQVETSRDRILINTSRAGIVEEEVLENIGHGHVFQAAGLDVYPDTIPDKADGRIIYTPHTAGITQEATCRMREELVEKLE